MSSTRFISRPRRAGFTLVEMLAALTIGSMIMVTVVSSTQALSRTRGEVGRRVERSEAARHAMEAIVGALRNVRRDRLTGKPTVIGRKGESSQGDRIDLMVIDERRVRQDGAESDQQEIGFFLSPAASARGTPPALMCRRDHALDEHPGDGGLVTVVAEGIVGLSFQYYVDRNWRDDWPEHDPRVPEAVRVTIVSADPASDRSLAMMPPQTTVFSTVVRLHGMPAQQSADGSAAADTPPGGQRP